MYVKKCRDLNVFLKFIFLFTVLNAFCDPGLFTCNNGECVDLEVTCNGHDDCVDASDENTYYCSKLKTSIFGICKYATKIVIKMLGRD